MPIQHRKIISYDHLASMGDNVEMYIRLVKQDMAHSIGRELLEKGIIKQKEKATNFGIQIDLELRVPQ